MEQEFKDDEIDYVMEFDRHYTNNHIQILKTLYSCVEGFPYIPVIIKYLELKQTLQMVRTPSTIMASEKNNFSVEKLYKAVKPYLTMAEDQSCQQILSLVHTIDQAKEMKQMMELMQMTQIFNNDDTSQSAAKASTESMDNESMEKKSTENTSTNNFSQDFDLSEMLKLISKEYNL